MAKRGNSYVSGWRRQSREGGFENAFGSEAESGVFVSAAREGNSGNSETFSARSDCRDGSEGRDCGTPDVTCRQCSAGRTRPQPDSLLFREKRGKSERDYSSPRQHPDCKITEHVTGQARHGANEDHDVVVFDSGVSCHTETDFAAPSSSLPQCWEAGTIAGANSSSRFSEAKLAQGNFELKDPYQPDYKGHDKPNASQSQPGIMVHRTDSSARRCPGCGAYGDAADTGVKPTAGSEKERRSEEAKERDESVENSGEDKFDSGVCCSVAENDSPKSAILENTVLSIRSRFSHLSLAIAGDKDKERSTTECTCGKASVCFGNPTTSEERESKDAEYSPKSANTRLSSEEEITNTNAEWSRQNAAVSPDRRREEESENDHSEKPEYCSTLQQSDVDEARPDKVHSGSKPQRQKTHITCAIGKTTAAAQPKCPDVSSAETVQRSQGVGRHSYRSIAALMEIRDEDGDTFLHNAIVHGQSELAIRLIHQLPWHPPYQTISRSFLNTPNYLSQTALHLAVVTSQYDVIRALVLAGASLEARDIHGNTPLHVACERDNLLSAIMLLSPETREEKACKQRARWGTWASSTHGAIPQNLELLNYEGFSCLHLAVRGHMIPFVFLLLFSGADINTWDAKSGRTALHHAADSGDVNLMQLLLKRPDADVNRRSFSGHTPFAIAWGRGHENVVRRLLAAGALWELDDDEGDDDECDEEAEANVLQDWQKIESE